MTFPFSGLEGFVYFPQTSLISESDHFKSINLLIWTLSHLLDCPITGEDRRRIERMISICFTWFSISGLGKPKLYQNMWCFTRMWGFYLERFSSFRKFSVSNFLLFQISPNTSSYYFPPIYLQ